MSILVTGGAGYIGSHTVRMLTALGHEVVVLDSMEYGHRSAVHRAPSWSTATSPTATLVVELCTRPRRHAGRALRRVQERRRVDGAARRVLAEQRHRHRQAGRGDAGRRRPRHRLLVSRARCTARRPSVPVDRGRADRSPRASTPRRRRWSRRILRWYGVTPRAARRSACGTSTPPAPAPTAAIGEDWRQSLNLIPLVMKATLGKRPPVQVFGNDYPTPDGTCIRDYIHVDDLADAHVQGARLPRRRRRIDGAQRRHRQSAAA